jgi:hypothetical protein
MEQAQAMMPDREKMKELVLATFDGRIGEFRPCAFFDEPLDCIRVIVRDCSTTEIRVGPLLTVLEDNDADPKPGRELYVGFTIKGARHFCQQQGIDLAAPVQWSELLDRILAESSDTAVRLAVNAIAKPLVFGKNIQPVTLASAA